MEKIEGNTKRRIKRPRKNPRVVVVHGARELSSDEGNALLHDLGRRMTERNAARLQSRTARLPASQDRRSVAHAMLMVEIRLVKAFWTIARQPLGTVIPLDSRRNGVSYVHDREDTHARYADAAGGKWDQAEIERLRGIARRYEQPESGGFRVLGGG